MLARTRRNLQTIASAIVFAGLVAFVAWWLRWVRYVGE
jgi:hypothetical protein